MAHKKSKKEVRGEKDTKRFEHLAVAEARRSLKTAVEWIDQGDTTWALVNVKRALAMLEAARVA